MNTTKLNKFRSCLFNDIFIPRSEANRNACIWNELWKDSEHNICTFRYFCLPSKCQQDDILLAMVVFIRYDSEYLCILDWRNADFYTNFLPSQWYILQCFTERRLRCNQIIWFVKSVIQIFWKACSTYQP